MFGKHHEYRHFFAARAFLNKDKTPEFSRHVSTLTAAFAQSNVDDLTTPVFEKLTNPKLLPHIDVQAALPLIDAERQVVAPDESRLSSLQIRCVAALSEKWESIDVRARGTVMSLAKKQSPLVLAEILACTLSAAKDTLSAANSAQAKLTKLTNELSGFQRLNNAPCVVVGSVTESFLPSSRIHNPFGTNAQIRTPSSNIYATYPLFYYKKP